MESRIQKKILDFLNDKDNCKAINFHVGRYNETGTPDIEACMDGQLIRIEVKDEDSSHELTPIQEHRMNEWCEVGAICFVARSVNEVENTLSDEGLL